TLFIEPSVVEPSISNDLSASPHPRPCPGPLETSPPAAYLAGGFRSENRQSGIGKQSNLLQHGGLVPINVFMRKLAIAKPHDRDQRHFDVAIRRSNPR